MDFKKFLSQDLSIIKKELNVDILKRKDDIGNTILHYLFCYTRSLHITKYVIKYCCKKYPSLILEKNGLGRTILHYLFYYNSLEKIKYVLKYCCKKYPSLCLKKDKDGKTIIYSLGPNGPKFLKYNFPEISIHTNNFILPLTMEIQN